MTFRVNFFVDPEINIEANANGCNIASLTWNSIFDMQKFLKRFPNELHLKFGLPITPFAKYDADLDRLEINLYPRLLRPLYGNGSLIDRDMSIRALLDHEMLESIKYSPAESQMKRLVTSAFSQLTTLLGSFNLPNEEFRTMFNTPEGISLMVDDVCQDIKVDRQLLHLEHYPKGFNLSHGHFLETDKFCFKHLRVEKSHGKIKINMSPYKVLYTLLPAMRRSVIAEEIRRRKLGGHYFGGFFSFVRHYTIEQGIRYPELQGILQEIHKELAAKNHHKAKIRELSNQFIEAFN